MRGKIQWFDLPKDLHKFQIFGKDQDGRYQASSYGELRVSISRMNIMNRIIWNIRRSEFKEQNQKYYQRDCFCKKLLLDALLEEKVPTIRGDKGR